MTFSSNSVMYRKAVSENRNEANPAIDVKGTLLTPRGRVIRLAEVEEPAPGAPKAESGGRRYVMSLPLDVEPGAYVISLEARSGTESPLTRTIPIRVR